MASSDRSAFDWDIFCRVVDNFGDIGVCWRLARGLAAGHGLAVRLWVDDWNSFRRLCPAGAEADPATTEGVDVRCWNSSFPAVVPAAAVVEAFGCELPDSYLAAMAARPRQPVWINLEYLSAEAWVEDCHLMRSPHPRLPIVKRFFFPGFSPRTGGLLREPGLLEARDRFQADAGARAAFLRGLGVPDADGRRVMSLFAYEQPALDGLLARWSGGADDVLLLVPEGRIVADVARYFGVGGGAPGTRFARGRLTAQVLPFIDQARYDRLLWACDLNFVRGEDSFVRAQWAGRPFVWHIYRQHEEAHRAKLDAFVGRYVAGMDAAASASLRAFWLAWNGWGAAAAEWDAFSACLPAISTHARRWAQALAGSADLASALVQFSAHAVE